MSRDIVKRDQVKRSHESEMNIFGPRVEKVSVSFQNGGVQEEWSGKRRLRESVVHESRKEESKENEKKGRCRGGVEEGGMEEHTGLQRLRKHLKNE